MPDGIWEVGGRPAPGPGRHAEPRKFRSALLGSIHPAATFAELGASGAGLVLGPKVPAGKRREHWLVDVGVIDHAVYVGPERLRMVGAERELDFGVEADEAGLFHHFAGPPPATGRFAAVESPPRPGGGVEDVCLPAPPPPLA